EECRIRLSSLPLDQCVVCFLRRATNFADQDHRFGMPMLVEEFARTEMRHPVNRVPADADAGRLAIAARRQLPDCLIRERSGTRYDANTAGHVNVSWHDSDLAGAGSNDAGTIRADQSRVFSGH